MQVWRHQHNISEPLTSLAEGQCLIPDRQHLQTDPATEAAQPDVHRCTRCSAGNVHTAVDGIMHWSPSESNKLILWHH